MTASAQFTISGFPSAGGVSVARGSTVTLALVDTAGVNSIAWSIAGSSDPSLTVPTITGPTGNNATFTMDSADGVGYIVKCLVNGGKDAAGRDSAALVRTGKVYTKFENETAPLVFGEELEESVTHGWTPSLNFIRRGLITVVTLQTTNGTVTTAATIPIADETSVDFGVRWFGNQVGGGNNWAKRVSMFTYRRKAAGAPALWGSATDTFPSTKDDATWGAMDWTVSGNNVILRVAGLAATTIDWKVEYALRVNR